METFVLIHVMEFPFSIWLLEMWGGGRWKKTQVVCRPIWSKEESWEVSFSMKVLAGGLCPALPCQSPALQGAGNGRSHLTQVPLQHFWDDAKAGK